MAPHYTSPNNQTQTIQTRPLAPNQQPSFLGTNYPYNNQSNNSRPARPRRPPVKPIPITYTEVLLRLIQGQLIACIPLTPIEPPYPCWYDANATCDYHYEITGHSTKNCLSLKNQVQALKNAGLVNFGYKMVSRIS